MTATESTDLLLFTTCELAVVGRGVAKTPDLSSLQSKRRASLYADPLSWLVLDAVEKAIGERREELLSAKESVGHIVVSDQCTTHTMREIGAKIPQGFISPLRFSGSNPGAIGSLPSQLLGFSGPSMVLSMPPDSGLAPAVTLARTWLREGSATHVLVTSHRADASGHSVISTILRVESAGRPP